MKMAASKINWAQFLAEGSELPPDVTFAVMEEVHAYSIYSDQSFIFRVNIFWAQGELGENEMVNLEDWRTVQVVS